MSKNLLVLLLAFTVFSVGCAKVVDYQSSQSVQAPDDINESFGSQDVSDAGLITISEESLEKEFLLEASLIEQNPVPMWNGLKPRVVAFRRVGDKLFLLEATQGHVVDTGVPTKYLITDFDILSDGEGQITFDFNAGMSRLFTAGAWYVKDYFGSDYKWGDNVLDIDKSFVLESKVNANKNRFLIRQIAQVRELKKEDGATVAKPHLRTVEVKYYLTPYKENNSFPSTLAPDFTQFGYFEIPPFYNDQGGVDILASKFDLNKPIVFAVSANTPADYVDAVKEGVLYWNKAFGNELVKVVMAPEGVNAPDMDYNVVQWVEWDQAGFAYADVQADPRTGEALHAHVFMTSVFAVASKARARALLGKYKKGIHSHAKLMLKGFEGTSRCNDVKHDGFFEALEELVNSDADDDAVLRFSQDYVRNTMAHEVGHDLGLRHNFAGNLGTTFSLKDKDALLEDYLVNGRVASDVRTSSSVMEYTSRFERGLSGHQVKHLDVAFDYDLASIENLYYGKEFPLGTSPLFCTDKQAKVYVDCRRHDSGNSVLENAKYGFEFLLERSVTELIATFIGMRVPFPGNHPKDLDQFNPKLTSMANNILEWRHWAFLGVMNAESKWLAVHRQFPVVGDLNDEVVKSAQEQAILAELDRIGLTLKEVFAPIPEDYADNATSRFAELIRSDYYRKGKGPADGDYVFSEEDINLMVSLADNYFHKLQEKMVELDLKVVKDAEIDKVVDGKLGELVEEILLNRAIYFGLTEDANKTSEVSWSVGEKSFVSELTGFYFSTEIRGMALSQLNGLESDDVLFGVLSREQLKEDLGNVVKRAKAGASDDELKKAPLSVRRWLKVQERLADAI